MSAYLKVLKGGIEKEEKQRTQGTEDYDEARAEARASAKYRRVRSAIVRAIEMWYRDVLILHCGADENLVSNQAALDLLRKKVSGCGGRP